MERLCFFTRRGGVGLSAEAKIWEAIWLAKSVPVNNAIACWFGSQKTKKAGKGDQQPPLPGL
ncbi:MAG: hypothetical protein D6715_03475 [Calditrichaeota bacterium]|nr:MAG: hypothetical protein D6715_03475 [Calditrichota bacterium]